jgi:hypothetical protein
MSGAVAMTSRAYLGSVRAILAAGLSDEEAERQIDELKRQRLHTFKEISFVQNVSYRTVQRWAAKGKVKVVETPSGKRIIGVA